MHPEHPCHEEERPLAPSGPTTFDLAGRRASLGLAAHLGHGVKMPRLRFYNRRSRHEHSMSTPPLETACRAPWASPPASSFEIEHRQERCRHLAPLPDAGPPRGHPASSGCVLDGTRAGFGSIDCRTDARLGELPGAPRASATEVPALFRLTGYPVDRHLWRPLPAAGNRSRERSLSRPPDHGRPRARQRRAASPRSRHLPSYGADPGRSRESP